MERYHVTKRKDGRWDVKAENSGKPSITCDTQQEAIDMAVHYIGRKGEGVILIHGAYKTEQSQPGRINRVQIVYAD